DGGDLAAAGRAARLVAMRTLVEGLPPKTLLNVNVPPKAPRGLRFTRLGHRVYSGKIVEHVDPRGRTHYWLGSGQAEWEALDGTDMGAVHEGFVAVTPVHLDLTNHRGLALMASWTSALDAQWRRSPASSASEPPASQSPTRRPPAGRRSPSPTPRPARRPRKGR
ncbi:MAG TPA: hypothetical protein VLV15_04760, partial [Dongiaceae bacterium]|nr:hypothetical protein [Dongiaceae bacterium]